MLSAAGPAEALGEKTEPTETSQAVCGQERGGCSAANSLGPPHLRHVCLSPVQSMDTCRVSLCARHGHVGWYHGQFCPSPQSTYSLWVRQFEKRLVRSIPQSCPLGVTQLFSESGFFLARPGPQTMKLLEAKDSALF